MRRAFCQWNKIKANENITGHNILGDGRSRDLGSQSDTTAAGIGTYGGFVCFQRYGDAADAEA